MSTSWGRQRVVRSVRRTHHLSSVLVVLAVFGACSGPSETSQSDRSPEPTTQNASAVDDCVDSLRDISRRTGVPAGDAAEVRRACERNNNNPDIASRTTALPPPTTSTTVPRIESAVLGGTYSAFVRALGEPDSTSGAILGFTLVEWKTCPGEQSKDPIFQKREWSVKIEGGPKETTKHGQDKAERISHQLCSGRMTAQRAIEESALYLPPDAKLVPMPGKRAYTSALLAATGLGAGDCGGKRGDLTLHLASSGDSWTLEAGLCGEFPS